MTACRPLISIVAAMSENRVIGRGNRLPWHLPADLAHFKGLTLNKPIVMGRRTWESLPGPLPQRTHIVVTRNRSYSAQGCLPVGSPMEAIEAAGPVPELMVVGGAGIYRDLLPLARRMYLTLVAAVLEGDVWFPDWDRTCWREVARKERRHDERNRYDLTFVTLDRQTKQPIPRPLVAGGCQDPLRSAGIQGERVSISYRSTSCYQQGWAKPVGCGERGMP